MAGKNKSKDIKDIEVIQPNNTDSTPKTAASNTNSTAVSAASPRSWVWSYFKVVSIISDNNPKSEESEGVECQAASQNIPSQPRDDQSTCPPQSF
ncbi:hypothetical protein PGTUg99_015684 [Puccinia graminis f. sp. tritici]|uniref:Uncharacterized protein n=1 Tax=Puccinia graminis f. sp. tritici TaxID=56615 RepID=A0A5B0RE06_PUCGR|nr:hypothetical protein PGTUg99_015684 [Puccinia graminis f. sp. tritici]